MLSAPWGKGGVEGWVSEVGGGVEWVEGWRGGV
jgi:hypothetical protein